MATLELVNTGAAAGTCPPADVYTLVLTGNDGIVQKPIFDDKDKAEGEQRMENQVRMHFRIVGVSDNEDEELAGWIGEELTQWFTWPKNPLHELAKIGNMARAILKVTEFAVGETIDMDDLYEKPFRAKIVPKKSGWPKIDGFMEARGRVKSAAPKKVATVTDEEDGSWPEE